jgi:hypothetical protein
MAVMRHRCRCPDPTARYGATYLPMMELLENAHSLLLQRLPEQKWAEYFDGPTGVWMGQQARLYQTWSIAGLLLSHHLLKVKPDDADIMDLPSLRALNLQCQHGFMVQPPLNVLA